MVPVLICFIAVPTFTSRPKKSWMPDPLMSKTNTTLSIEFIKMPETVTTLPDQKTILSEFISHLSTAIITCWMAYATYSLVFELAGNQLFF